VGKGTLIRGLLEAVPGLELSVSATTRDPRADEIDGRDYYFLSADDFERRVEAGDFVEHAVYAGSRYGTLHSELERQVRGILLEVDLQGARQVRSKLPDAIQIFIAPPSLGELEERLRGRSSDSEDQIHYRLSVAPAEMAAREEFSRVVVNDELQRALRELVELAATMCLPLPGSETA